MKIKNNRILPIICAVAFLGCVEHPNGNNANEEYYPKIVLTPEEFASVAYDNPEELTDSEVSELVKGFVLANEGMGNSVVTRGANLSAMRIVNKSYISSFDGTAIETASRKTRSRANAAVPVYEVEVGSQKGEGYAVVCGDERAAKVIFYCTDSPQDREMDISTRYLLELSKKSVLADIEQIEQIRKETREATLEKIGSELNIPINEIRYDEIKNSVFIADDEVSTRTNIPGNPVGGHGWPPNILSFVNPMTVVTWHQGEPYNWQIPIGDLWDNYQLLSTYPGHYNVGCANVCIAQLFSILKVPMYGLTLNNRSMLIDWNYITSVPTIFVDEDYPEYSSPPRMVEMIGALMHRLYIDCEAEPDEITNEETGVTATIQTNVEIPKMLDYLDEKTTFSGSVNFNGDFAKQSLTALKPVLLYGFGHDVDKNGIASDEPSGHAFLIDGYFVCRKPGQTSFDNYWSVNMGWEGNMAKGYFLTGSNLTNCDIVFEHKYGTITYNTQEQQMLYNIAKK